MTPEEFFRERLNSREDTKWMGYGLRVQSGSVTVDIGYGPQDITYVGYGQFNYGVLNTKIDASFSWYSGANEQCYDEWGDPVPSCSHPDAYWREAWDRYGGGATDAWSAWTDNSTEYNAQSSGVQWDYTIYTDGPIGGPPFTAWVWVFRTNTVSWPAPGDGPSYEYRKFTSPT